MMPIVSDDPAHVSIEDLPIWLNPVQVADLRVVLACTVASRRVAVLLAFTELDQRRWAALAGASEVCLCRWLQRKNRFPFGWAYRLAHVVGVDADLLFADYL